MFHSIKSKIVIPTVAVVTVLLVVVIVYSLRATAELGNTLSEQRIVSASRAAHSYLHRLEERNVITAGALSGNPTIIAFVTNWNNNVNRAQTRLDMLEYLNNQKEHLGIHAFVVVDSGGNVILRTHELDRYGDPGMVSPPIANALLRGISSSVFSSTPALPMAISGAAPIRSAGTTIGTITTLVNMASDYFVDNFGMVFGAEVTVFRGTESIASTLILPATGARAVGTHVAPHVAEVVIDRGEPLGLPLMIFGLLPHHAYYFPLMGWGGTPAGMLFVGFSTEYMLTATSNLQRDLIFIGAIGLVLTAALMFVYIMRMLNPLGLLARNLNEIANGDADLTKRLSDTGKDEIAAASRYFNQTMEGFRKMIASIKDQAGTLADIGNDLASNMTETASAMNEITANIKSIKTRVLNQSASVLQTNSTMEQVSSNISRLSGQVETQASVITQSSAAIEEMLASINSVTTTLVQNAVHVNELQDSADTSRSSLNEVATDIQDIAKESEGLMEINSVMENIASQTNLLSMNAAIEAAHAGDAGRGFAVVADEIRKLAESSSEQSKTIGLVLKKIKGSIDKISHSTDKVLDKFGDIDHGVRTVAEQEGNIRNAMEEQNSGSKNILQAASQVNDITTQVRTGAEEMLQGSSEVISEAKNLDMLTQEISRGMAEMAVGAEQVNQAVNTVNDLSSRNRENISTLAQAVSRFKV